MKDTTKRVIAKLREANKCGRYSDATVERILEEVLEEEMKEMACCSAKNAKEEEPQEEEKPLTFREMLEDSGIDLDEKYKQVLIIAEDEKGVGSAYIANLVNIEETLDFYHLIKTKLKDMVLEHVPKYIVDGYERFKKI